ncbi:type II toxin-antitoxin system Phd/YefM family antitoxin [Corallococcus coralloides]|uniref:type II toxin-antitoxin system Phd/YefM family antitoxin n=1 Tax=Corallococcus coralloides TaxID=184914 RepID=UPI00384EC2DF
MQRISLSEARSHLSALVQQAASQRHLTAITVHDELKAFLIAPSRLEALLEAERKVRPARRSFAAPCASSVTWKLPMRAPVSDSSARH